MAERVLQTCCCCCVPTFHPLCCIVRGRVTYEIRLVAFLENRQNCCHQMSDFMAKMHQIRFQLGLRPRPTWGVYSAPPDPLAGFKGAYFSANLFTVELTHVALCQWVRGVIGRTI